MSRKALGTLLLTACAAMPLCSCHQKSIAPGSGVVDSGSESDSAIDTCGDEPGEAAEAGDPWDPVWHETQPRQWPLIGPEGQPDCGAGCRIAINGTIAHNLYYSHGFTAEGVADLNGVQLLYAPLLSSTTRVLDTTSAAAESFVEHYLFGDYLIYLRSELPSSGQPANVELVNLTTGERKVVYSYLYSGPGDLGVSFTALNSSFAFWKREGKGLMSRNLNTGEVRVLTPSDLFCVRVCTTESAVICGDQNTAKVVSIDQETGTVAPLDDGIGLQIESGCSADRKQVAWVDYRDPPGPGSDLDFNRSGGEIYLRDLEKNETRRLTFDSPSSPRGKTYASIGDGLVMWREAPPGTNVNPTSAQELYGATTTLVVLDLGTNKKCRIDIPVISSMLRNSVHGRHIYGYWVPTPGDPSRLVDIDLDNPAIECKPYQ